jgi:hypothetical protein
MTRARDVASQGGLVLLSTTTIGSAVSSVTVNNAFSATYENYQILISDGVGSTNSMPISFRLTGITNSNYGNLIYSNFASGSVISLGISNTANISYAGLANTSSINMQLQINSPFLPKFKLVSTSFIDANNSGRGTYQINSTTSSSGFTLTPNGGTLTGGTIKVYGYK